MALSIKMAEADELARTLARLTGESITETIITALRERLFRERVRRQRDSASGSDGKTDDEIAARHAASVFLKKLRGRYDVARAIMFGSRARGDNRLDSDLDLAIVLNGPRGDFLETKLDMAGIAFDVMMDVGILVQPFPMWDGDLTNPAHIERISDDGVRLG